MLHWLKTARKYTLIAFGVLLSVVAVLLAIGVMWLAIALYVFVSAPD